MTKPHVLDAKCPPGRRSGAIRLLVFTLLVPATTHGQSPPAKGEGAPAGQDVVNINTACAEQLQLLPRVGPAMAGRIIAHREKRPFRRPVELRRIRGIGAKTYRLLQPHVTVDGPTTLRQKVRRAKG